MQSITTPDFIEAFKRYYSDSMYIHYLNDVKEKFIAIACRKEIKGIQYTTLCLLIAQAMENMLAAYGGHGYTDKRLDWSNHLVRKLLFLSGILISRKDGYSALHCERTSFLAREILKNLFDDKLPEQAKLYFKKTEYFYR